MILPEVSPLWAGLTVFYDLGSYPQVYDHVVTEDRRRSRQAPMPNHLTPEKRQLHSLTHLPYRSWCQVRLRPQSAWCLPSRRFAAPSSTKTPGRIFRYFHASMSLPTWPAPGLCPRRALGTTHSLNDDELYLSAAVRKEYTNPTRGLHARTSPRNCHLRRTIRAACSSRFERVAGAPSATRRHYGNGPVRCARR